MLSKAVLLACTGISVLACGRTESRDSPPKLRAVLVDNPDTKELIEFKTQGTNAVVLELASLSDKKETRAAAARVRACELELYYWIEIARNKAMADAHPEWMCSVQGHKDWRRLFEKNTVPNKGEVVKTYPWVPILYKETFAAHLKRVRKLLDGLPRATGVFLNDLQSGPSACGCGSPFCRWTSDYGTNLTATPYSKHPTEKRHFPGVVDAAADFVQEVQKLAPGVEVIPVWMTECEAHDRPGVCGNVGCYNGYCWRYYEEQLDRLVPRIRRLGALTPYKAMGRDLPVYKEKAGWVKWALDSYGALPPHKKKKVLEARQLVAVLQGWDVTREEVEAQVRRTQEAGADGYVLSLVELDQSWEPRIVKVP